MKRIFAIAAATLLFAGCQKEDNTPTPAPAPTPVVLGFEETAVVPYLAGPTSKGENLYATFGEGQYKGYTDTTNGLSFGFNADDKGEYNFWNGGIVLSRFIDKTVPGPDNQCSVYGAGGAEGSNTFAVVNYSTFMPAGVDGSGGVEFTTDGAEAKFDHFYVTNNTYAVLSMQNGDGYEGGARKFETGDWFLLTVTATDKSGAATGTPVKFYLADLRTASSPGIVTEWTKVDLTGLGDKVHKLSFALTSSDNNAYGMLTPAYFCFDNLTYFK